MESIPTNIEGRVKKILIEQLGVKEDEIVPKADFVDDLGADSVDTVELVIKFEEEFGFEISDEDAERMKKVRDVIAYLQKSKGSNR